MTRRLTPYVPTSVDLGWAQQQINLLRDGGMIGTSNGTYRLDKTTKTLTRIEPWDATPMSMLLHFRHHHVWKALGYTVVPTIDWDAFELPDNPPFQENP